MEQIVIGFSKSKKHFAIGSWLIRLFMGTPYSHVYLKFYSKSLDRTLVYEAVGSGVRFVGSKIWEEHAIEVKSCTVNISKESQIKLLQWCVDNAGVDYGYWQNLGVVISRILSLKKNPFTHGLNCSETLADLLDKEGYKISKDVNLITPLDIDIILRNQVRS